jgi:acetyl esterase/lipase
VFLGRGFVRQADIAYGSGPRQRLDVYRPRAARGATRTPVVVFLHGGRWQRGSKNDYRLLGDTFTGRGWVVIVPDLRVYPDTVFPAWVEDAARAVRWTRDHAAELGGDPDRLFVVGHSSGAHTAALLALDERYLRAAGVPANVIRGVVSVAGPVDTTWTDPDVQALMGPRAGWPASYPATHLDAADPPLLLLHGASDRTVAPQNSVDLAARLQARGGCARAIVYRGVGHVAIVAPLLVPELGNRRILRDLAAFVQEPRMVPCPARR